MQELMKVRIDARFLKIYEKYVEAWRNSAKTPAPTLLILLILGQMRHLLND